MEANNNLLNMLKCIFLSHFFFHDHGVEVLLRIAHHLEEEKEGLRAEDVWVQKGLVIGGFRGGVRVIYG